MKSGELTDKVSLRSRAQEAGLQMWCGLRFLPFHTRCSTALTSDRISRRNGPGAGAEHWGRLGLEGTTEWLRLPTAARCSLLLTVLISNCGVRPAPDGAYWPVSDDSDLVW